MDKKKYDRAVELQSEIRYLYEQLDASDDCSPRLGMTISVKYGYSDMGRDIERHMNLRGCIAIDVWGMVREVLKTRINELEAEFEKL